ncbi:MAG TPA: glycerol-3-phosphate 1-O-acyltransferase [bacterium]|nr:glycerol-3-phosphate 1-O-acyltransferase [bacterium]
MLFLSIILSYLLGAVPASYIMGRVWKGIDLREHGSGNVGAANTFRVLGPVPGIIVLFIDVLKGLIAVLLISRLAMGSSLSSEWVKVFCGIAAICGHNWTIFLRFKGGRGVATSTGVFLGLAWQAMLLVILVWLVIVALTRYISLGSILGAVALPILVYTLNAPLPYLFFSVLASLLVIIKHIPNIKRLIKGKENRLSFRKK